MLLVPPVMETSVPVALLIVPALAVKLPVERPVIWMPVPVLFVDHTVANVAPLPRLLLVRSTAAPPVALMVLAVPPMLMVPPLAARPKPPSVVIASVPKVKLLVAPMPVEQVDAVAVMAAADVVVGDGGRVAEVEARAGRGVGDLDPWCRHW